MDRHKNASHPCRERSARLTNFRAVRVELTGRIRAINKFGMTVPPSTCPPVSASAPGVPAESGADLWITLTPDGRYADYQAARPGLLLQPPEGLLGRHYREVLPPAVAQELSLVWERLKETGRPQTFAYELPLPDGRREFVAYLSLGASGQVLVLVQDVTRTTDPQEEVRQISDQLRVVSEASGLGYWEWTAAPDRIWRDQRLLQIYGVDHIGPDTASWAALIHPEDRADTVRYVESALADPNNHGYVREFRIVRPDGIVRCVRTQAVLQRDDAGKIVRALGVDSDFTEEKERADRFRVLSDRLVLAARAADFGVWDWDMRTAREIWDDRMCELYHVPKNEAGNYAAIWESRVHPEDLPRVKAATQAALAEGYRLDTQFRILWPDGTVRHIKDDALIQRDANNRPVRVIGINRDVTADRLRESEMTRSREAAEAASLAKSAFLAAISHELRTPLNGILGFASLLADTPLQPEQAEFVGYISHSSEILLAMINDLLDISRIEAGRLSLNPKPFALREVIEEAVRRLGPKAAEKSLKVSTRWHAGLPTSFVSDLERVRQVIMNLVSNAIKFSTQGTVTVEASPDEPGFARISVTDTGIGIAPDKQPLLFQKFVQAETTTTRRFGGAGLGLAISRQLVELMGGKIGFTSEPGKGSTFWFTLPHAPAEPVRTIP